MKGLSSVRKLISVGLFYSAIYLVTTNFNCDSLEVTYPGKFMTNVIYNQFDQIKSQINFL